MSAREPSWHSNVAVADVAPTTPVLQAGEGLPVAGGRSPSVFGDDVWNLAAAVTKPTAEVTAISFASAPPAYRTALKRLVWCLLNLPTPVDELARNSAVRPRVTVGGADTIYIMGLRPFSRWLADRGVLRLAEVDLPLLEAYAAHVHSGAESRRVKGQRLVWVTRIWLLAPYLPSEDRLVQPPWEPDGVDAFLGPSQHAGENKTIPVHPQTMSPLLVWSLRFVGDFSDDILTARDDRDALAARVRMHSCRGDLDIGRAYLDRMRQAGTPLPGTRNGAGRRVAAREYIAAQLGIGYRVLTAEEYADLPVELGAPLPTAIRGHIDGQPWTDAIDYYHIDRLLRCLTAACLVVIGYLSGMRGEECRALRRGCLRAVDLGDGATHRYELHGTTFKTAIDDAGNTIPAGVDRDQPWMVIEPVARAIAVLERLHSQDVLFSTALLNDKRHPITGNAIRPKIAADLIDSLINRCNDLAARCDRLHEHIPADPDGRVTLGRFRRTLAWFIYRLPAGRIALGIQYGHLNGYTTDAYGSRASAGLRDVFPMEEVYARSEQLNAAADRLEAGEAISGPAADRYLDAVTTYAATYRGHYLSPRQAVQLQKDPRLRIFDNADQTLACCYDATKALCHPAHARTDRTADTPFLTRCDPACANVARTDHHIEQLRAEIRWHHAEATSPHTPEPLQLRHQQRSATLQQTIDAHQAHKQTPALATDPPAEPT